MKKGVVILLMFFSINSIGQNLVLNGDFETRTSCAFGNISEANDWYSPYGSIDYFSGCMSNPLYLTPLNRFGYQLPKSGDSYIGMTLLPSDLANAREYVSGKLTSPLIQGEKYCVSFFINKSDSSNYSYSEFGCYISEDSIITGSPISNILGLNTTHKATDNITDTLNWVEVNFEYIAKGNELYIAFGLFEPVNSVDTTKIGNNGSFWDVAYYYIDDVSLTLCPDIFPSDSLNLTFPNVFTPNGDEQNDNFVIDVYGYHNIKSMEVQVFNRWGQRIKYKQFEAVTQEATENNITQLHIWDGFTNAAAEAPNGTYFYTVSYTTINDETFTEKSFLTLFR